MNQPTRAAITISAINRAVFILVCASTIEYPKPALVAMNSAQMTLIHPALTPARMPVSSSGMAAGMVIL